MASLIGVILLRMPIVGDNRVFRNLRCTRVLLLLRGKRSLHCSLAPLFLWKFGRKCNIKACRLDLLLLSG